MPDPILNDNGYVPSVPVVEDRPLPTLPSTRNPFDQIGAPGLGGSTHEPAQREIGGDTASLSSRAEQLKGKTGADPYFQAQRFETPQLDSYEAAAGSPYFEQLGVRPGMDIEEVYGQAQTNWNKLGRAFGGALSLAAHQFVDQFTSWGDTADLFTSDPVFKQAELEEINKWQKQFDQDWHIFQTQEDRNTFFNMSNFSNMIQQSGYAIGAVLEIAAEEYLLSALTAATFGAASELQAARTLQLASRLGKVARRTRELEKTIQGTGTLRKIFNSGIGKLVNPVGDLTEFAMDFGKLRRADQLVYGAKAGLRTAARGFGAFYRDMRMINAGITEAKAEAAGVMQDTYENLLHDYTRQYGAMPSAQKEAELKQRAYEAAQKDGAVQAMWIAMSDRIAFDGVLKSFRATRFIDDELATRGIFRNTKAAIKEGGEEFVAKDGFVKSFVHQLKTSPFKTLLKAPLTYTKENVMEGVQEIGQDIINETTKNWYTYKYGTPEQRKELRTVSDMVYEAAHDQLTMDGLKTFMSGFLTGGIMNVLGRGIRSGRGVVDRLRNQEGYQDTKARAKADREALVTSLNSLVKDRGTFYRNLVEMHAEMQKAAKAGDKKAYWDYKTDFLNKYTMDLVKSGMHDVVIDRLAEATQELTPDEFKAAFNGALSDGMSETEAKRKMTDYLEEFRNRVKEVKETYEAVRDGWGNPFNPARFKKGTDEYNKEVANYMAHQEAVEQIAFAKQTYVEIAKRQKGILAELSAWLPTIGLNSLYTITSPYSSLNKELDLLEKEIKAIQDPKLKKEKEKRFKQLSDYQESLSDLFEALDKAGGDREKVRKAREKYIKKHGKKLHKLLNEKEEETLSVDLFNMAVNDVLDYIELQHDHDEALSYFNTVANPFNFEGLHQAHYEAMLNLQQEAQQPAGTQTGTATTTPPPAGTQPGGTGGTQTSQPGGTNNTAKLDSIKGKKIIFQDTEYTVTDVVDFEGMVMVTIKNAKGEEITDTLDDFTEKLKNGTYRQPGTKQPEEKKDAPADELEAWLRNEYEKVKVAAAQWGNTVPPYEDWKKTSGKFATERYHKMKAEQNKPADPYKVGDKVLYNGQPHTIKDVSSTSDGRIVYHLEDASGKPVLEGGVRKYVEATSLQPVKEEDKAKKDTLAQRLFRELLGGKKMEEFTAEERDILNEPEYAEVRKKIDAALKAKDVQTSTTQAEGKIVSAQFTQQGTQVELEIIGKTGKEALFVFDRNRGWSIFTNKKQDGSYTQGDPLSKEDIDKLVAAYVPRELQVALLDWQEKLKLPGSAEIGSPAHEAEKNIEKLLALHGKPTAADVLQKKKEYLETKQNPDGTITLHRGVMQGGEKGTGQFWTTDKKVAEQYAARDTAEGNQGVVKTITVPFDVALRSFMGIEGKPGFAQGSDIFSLAEEEIRNYLLLQEEDDTSKDVKDYDQTYSDKRSRMEKDNERANLDYQEGLKQKAPADSLANTTDLVKEERSGDTVRYVRDGVNTGYVFDVATKNFMPGYSVTYKVRTSDFEPVVNRLTGEKYDRSKIFNADGTVKPEMLDYFPIGIYATIRGQEVLIGHLHEPQWIEYKIGQKFPHIVVPESELDQPYPPTVKNEVEKLRKLRTLILENHNKKGNFVLHGKVTDKSIGVIRTIEEIGLLKDRVNPQIAEGSIENRHGMFGIVRQGSIQVDRNVEAEKLEQTESFAPENIGKYEGVPVLLLPTPRGTYFPTFVKLPNVDQGQAEFIIEAWKAFTGQTSNPELVAAVYDSLKMYMSEGKPDIGVLKKYINQYITVLNDEKLSKIGSKDGVDVKPGAARLNITRNGEIYLQVKDGDTFHNLRAIKSASQLPENITELLQKLLTTVKFPDKSSQYVVGINSTRKVPLLTMKDGKLQKREMTYNQYLLEKAGTFVDKGIESKTAEGDWVYFANPVVKMDYQEPKPEPDITLKEEKKPKLEEVTEAPKDNKGASLLAFLKSRNLSEQQLKDQEKICKG